ncbi:tRNA epoxyqueuosine(34) reductase QueG [Prochlorococcus sp. MIT 1300]|uniref:tRNA epoxyqueuosine(34) reductase QueG n=1 Tax=Prochlorococcus sp. MIT 1300 TaxID=3096218 RepID=UPI002A759169|nr:tRNA epoxyqueuosine(34) reductase QueG [Prochlorococcus sp. MIT 1300]
MKAIWTQSELTQELKNQAKIEGFTPVGIARIPGSKRLSLRTAALERWLNANYQADMNWMAAERRKKIETLLEGVCSVLAVGLNYYVDKNPIPGTLSIARYGWGKDYHKVVNQRLRKIGRWLEKERPGCRWKVCVDTAPLLDKAWAEEAGIGWIGKNSNLINAQNGSWMVIGHLLCTEPLIPDKPATPSCGQCQLCLEHCPTNAITEPFVVDARLCIAYHNIENRNSSLPSEITESIGNWVAGCDICQEICPWNQKPLPSSKDPDVQPKPWVLGLTTKQALQWDDETWKTNLRNSALKRIKPWMWRRNAYAVQKKKKKSF